MTMNDLLARTDNPFQLFFDVFDTDAMNRHN